MILRKRLMGNGIKKDQSSSVNVPPSQTQVLCLIVFKSKASLIEEALFSVKKSVLEVIFRNFLSSHNLFLLYRLKFFKVVRDASRHVVSYSYNRNHTVLVEYSPDPYKDMFQVI